MSRIQIEVNLVKYFFLSDGWVVGRVWEFGGLWDELSWRRKPDIVRMHLAILERDEKLWLYRVEDAVLMVEVKPSVQPTQAAQTAQAAQAANNINITTIGQVVLKRLMDADQAIELLCAADMAMEK
jgi:hypothetical protein